MLVCFPASLITTGVQVVSMPIVSISLSDRLLEELDNTKEELGFSGRSEIVRTAIRSLLRERQDIEKLDGTIDSVIITTHDDAHAGELSKIQHDYEDIITTQLHNHLENHKCLELFVLHGDAAQVRAFWEALQSSDDVEQSKIMTP